MANKDVRLDALLLLLAEVGNKKTKLAERIKKSPAQISQWLGGYRTISEDSARDIEHAFPKPPGWMDNPKQGTTPPIQGGRSRFEPPFLHDVDHVEWEGLVSTNVPAVFTLNMPDESMYPRVYQGKLLLFSSTKRPVGGDGVLVKDAAGYFYVRKYRARSPESWQAVAINDSFDTLDSKRDGLQIVAVVIGEEGRWSAED